jgi:hypothetical protein
MDSQDSRFTTLPPPDYGNLYDADTPPSAQPRSPPLSLPDSQKTTQSWDRNSSQQTTQSWDSRDNRPVTPELLSPELLTHSQLLPDSLASQPSPPLFVPDSQAESSQGSNTWTRAIDCTRDKRLQIQTALLFKIPWAQIKETLDVTDSQINYAKNNRLTPQKSKTGRHAKLHTPEKTTLKE